MRERVCVERMCEKGVLRSEKHCIIGVLKECVRRCDDRCIERMSKRDQIVL